MCLSRPKSPPPPPTPPRPAAPANQQVAELDINPTDAETDAEVRKKKRRGKRGLTVDRSVQTGSTGTGLNIPTKS